MWEERFLATQAAKSKTLCVGREYVSRDFTIKLDYIKNLTVHSALYMTAMTFACEISSNLFLPEFALGVFEDNFFYNFFQALQFSLEGSDEIE